MISARNNGHASNKYRPKGIHHTKSLVIHSTIAESGHVPLRISAIIPIPADLLSVSPTAAWVEGSLPHVAIPWGMEYSPSTAFLNLLPDSRLR